MEKGKRRKKYEELEAGIKKKLRSGEQIMMVADIEPYKLMFIDLGIVVLLIVVMRFFYRYMLVSLLGNIGVVFFAYFASDALNYGTHSCVFLTNYRIYGVIKSREFSIPLREIRKCLTQGNQILIIDETGQHIELKDLRNQEQFYAVMMDWLRNKK